MLAIRNDAFGQLGHHNLADGKVQGRQFECIVPASAGSSTPARISLYGHGLLGSHGEVEAGNVEAMAREHNFVFCATDWWGLASPDTAYDASALVNLNRFPAVVDRLQQGAQHAVPRPSDAEPRRARVQPGVQKSDFLQPGGVVVDVCGGKPCHTFNYTP